MICIDNISVRSGDFILKGVSLEIKQGESVALMGKSGSGKSTIMEAICGLRELVSGLILINGEDCTYKEPQERRVGLVPQDNVLFPTMTVYEHLAYGAILRKWSKADIVKRVDELAGLLGLSNLLERYPSGLSGGEAKRVAIGRAIAVKPVLLCLDESFTGLDNETLADVLAVIQSIVQRENMSVLFITHRLEEAKIMCNKLYLIPKEGGFLEEYEF